MLVGWGGGVGEERRRRRRRVCVLAVCRVHEVPFLVNVVCSVHKAPPPFCCFTLWGVCTKGRGLSGLLVLFVA